MRPLNKCGFRSRNSRQDTFDCPCGRSANSVEAIAQHKHECREALIYIAAYREGVLHTKQGLRCWIHEKVLPKLQED